MSAGALKCSGCGRPLSLLKVLPRRLGHLTRYKCTCLHCEDLKDSGSWVGEVGRPLPVVEGFEERPYEWVAIVYH